MTGRTVRNILLVVCSLLTGCAQDQRTPIGADVETNSFKLQPENVRTGESAFYELARRAPSSAGFYFDMNGGIVVRLKNLAELSVARAVIEQMIVQRKINPGGARRIGTINFERADYSYFELAASRDIAASKLLGTNGTTMVDLDEVKNRVTIGVSRSSESELRRGFASVAQSIGLDPRMTNIEAFEPVPEMHGRAPANGIGTANIVNPTPNGNCAALQMVGCRPIVAGLAIGSAQGGCSLGFVVQYSSAIRWITGSHCTTNIFATSNDVMYNTDVNVGTRIGTEIYDPAGNTCYVLYTCRDSDAALFGFDSASVAELGLIARPVERKGPGQGSGSTTISSAQPYLRIDFRSEAYSNMMYEKIGRHTGWTYGYINATCVDYTVFNQRPPNRKIQCVDKGTAPSDSGDSGGPAFTLYDSISVGALGIVTANPSGGTLYSRIDKVSSDLTGSAFGLVVNRPSTLVAPFLTVNSTINGHELSWTVVPGATQYQIEVIDGCTDITMDGPYSYQQFAEQVTMSSLSTTYISGTNPACGQQWDYRYYWLRAFAVTETGPYSNQVVFYP